MRRASEDLPHELADMGLSAIQMAELADVRTKDIHYWAREEFLLRNRNGSRRPFRLSEVPKARLMGELTRKYEMTASRASALADKLLVMHESEPDKYVAVMSLLAAFDQSLETLAEVMAKLRIVDALAEEGLVNMERFAKEARDGRPEDTG